MICVLRKCRLQMFPLKEKLKLCVHIHTRACDHIPCVPWYIVFSFHHLCPRDQTQVIRLDGKHLYLLSNLTSLYLFWETWSLTIHFKGLGCPWNLSSYPASAPGLLGWQTSSETHLTNVLSCFSSAVDRDIQVMGDPVLSFIELCRRNLRRRYHSMALEKVASC